MTLQFVCLLVASAVVIAQSAVPPEEYDLWSAADKVAWWRDNLDTGRGGSEDSVHYWDYPREQPKRCVEAECVHLGGQKTRKDVVEPYGCKQRNLHPTGIVAWAKAFWEPNNYTGMFQGTDVGFVRWGFNFATPKTRWMQSLYEGYRNGTYKPRRRLPEHLPAGGVEDLDCELYDCFRLREPPVYDGIALHEVQRPDAGQFMAVKFFRDGVPSANLHLASRQETTWNHFSRWYSNLLMNIDGEPPNTTSENMGFAQTMTEQGAQRGTQWPGFTGLHDMAMYNLRGELQHVVHFPWQLIFFPTNATYGLIPDSLHGSYRDTLRLARKLGQGTTLFDIYAKDSFGAPLVKIGRLELSSELMLSEDTDRQVFFYHQRYERDLVLRPDLLQGLNCRDWWTCPLCPSVPELCFPSVETLDTWSQIQKNLLSMDMLIKRPLSSKASRVPYTCTGPRSAAAARKTTELEKPQAQQAGSALQQGSTVLGRARRRLRRQRPVLAAALAPEKNDEADEVSQFQHTDEAAMREDDYDVDPVSQLQHTKRWVCTFRKNQWPTAPRPWPFTSPCDSELVPEHLHSEAEYALAPGCKKLPKCNKFDGTWYSSTYPCRCGSSTCKTGQLCMAAADTCQTWGPYANQSHSSG